MREDAVNFDHLIVQGAKYMTTLTNKFKKRKLWKQPNQNLIYSFIPGTIIDVFVAPGQKVKQGDKLLILEAMKMHNNVIMPFDGEVIRVNVEPNDKVSKKQVMVEVRPK